MEMEILDADSKFIKIGGKFGKFYFANCPNCKKYIVNLKGNTVTCPNCRNKYRVQYPEE